MESFMCYGKMQKGRNYYGEESAGVGGLLALWIHGDAGEEQTEGQVFLPSGFTAMAVRGRLRGRPACQLVL